MKNLENLKAKKMEVLAKFSAAIKDNNTEAFEGAMEELSNTIQEAVMLEANGMIQASNNTVLAGRGVRALTTDETKYYQAVIGAMKSSNPKQALTDLALTMPLTVIEDVFADLVAKRPLLEAIDFQNTSGLVEFLVNTSSTSLATWSSLTAEIVTEAVAGFKKIPLAQKKLSAFLPISKSMLDLGPVWIDRYVRAILGEALLNGLEDGIIAGDGLLEPVGMIKNLAAAVDPVTGYASKAATAVTSFKPAPYGALIATLIEGPNGEIRDLEKALLIVNPLDYYSKIMPATTQMVNGVYMNDIFPVETQVIRSKAVPRNTAILGLPKRYFMGLGTAKEGKIDFSDEYRFLEDERVYLVKLYGNGTPKDNTSFLVLDITNLEALDAPVV